VRHARHRLQPHHRDHHLAPDQADGLFHDGRLLGAGAEICGLRQGGLRGKSPNLVYLYIHNDKVELRDAAHLAGKGAIETAELIKQELKQPKAQVAAIGMAGENRVFFASIEQGRSSASRGGIGAVMGDKGVKAIVVRGTKDVHWPGRPSSWSCATR
jgi:hypothetical protein